MVLIENQEYLCEEEKRLKQDRERTAYWKRWGPYVAERQWATGQIPLQRHSGVMLIHTQFEKIIRRLTDRFREETRLTNFIQC
ncbi:predicted protein [Plenodomus lingam JN3]|uniref:Predicted protein n=1 Tax=Leptosphaeria maculans (strain JN3 / isolate v23.1.3 / race Av1-4-5-6-7-8) TaxID=985895 RepID=E4ZNZ9_LEPMJ|nr:predicted protein [Plenodomus lingam JN3]CBX93368.1 predicted protein [Plenodomus lingam JN3]